MRGWKGRVARRIMVARRRRRDSDDEGGWPIDADDADDLYGVAHAAELGEEDA